MVERPKARRVLFVEPDPGTVGDIRSVLETRRAGWAASYVSTAAEALLACNQEPFDAVASTLDLAGTSGTALLESIAAQWPATIRILLADRSSETAALRAAPVAHDFLPTPLEPGSLGRALDSAAELSDLMHSPAVRALIGQPETLPAVPGVFLRLTKLLASEDVTIEDLARVVAEDPSLTGRVLQVANSPFFGGNRGVTAVDRAVAMLGSRLLKSLALVHGVFQSAEGTALPLDFDIHAEQTHGTAVGALARRLAGPARGDGAFSAGLLHDIGRLLLAVRAPQRFEEVVDTARREGLPMLEAERAVLGVDHAELGGYLLGVWGLPPAIVSAVRHHHNPLAEADRRGFAVFVHLADGLVREAELAAGTQEPESAPGEHSFYPPLFDKRAVGAACSEPDLAGWRDLVGQAG